LFENNFLKTIRVFDIKSRPTIQVNSIDHTDMYYNSKSNVNIILQLLFVISILIFFFKKELIIQNLKVLLERANTIQIQI
jgi:hypothetical protein